MQKWTTAQTVRGDPFAAWRTHLSEAFVRLNPSKRRDETFAGQICKADLGAIALSRVEASGHTVSRHRSDIRSDQPDIVFVNLQLTGQGTTVQAGREVVTRRFDLAVADTAQPYDIGHRDRFSLYSMALPKLKVPQPMLRTGRLRLSGTQRGRQLCGMIAAYAGLALDSETPPDLRRVSGHHILELLQVAAAQGRSIDPDPAAPLNPAIVLDYIRTHFAEPSLSAETLSHVFGVTPRYIHRLVAGTGSSVSEHVKSNRLRAACGLLENDTRRSISQIAMDCGFADPSYFNRSFKHAFGETPLEYRRRSIAA